MKIYLYLIINKINRKMYVGITNNIEGRFYDHCHNTESAIGRAIQKYGSENFDFEILDSVDSRDYACHLEQLYIKELRTFGSAGYNLTAGGEKDKEVSSETLAKLSASHKGLQSGKNNPNYGKGLLGENHPMYGKHHSEETLQKMREKKRSEESKQKNREAHLGKKHSAEILAKMSEALSGENNPQYGKRGKDSPVYGRKHSEEELQKMRENHRDFSGKNHPIYGKHLSPESIAKRETTKRINKAIHGMEKLDEMCFPLI